MQNNDITPFDRKLGRKVREGRQLRGMTQSELGKTLGVSYQQIQKHESGKNRVTAERLDLIGKALKLPLSYFLDPSDEVRSQWLFPADTIRLATSINDLADHVIRNNIKRLVHSINTAWDSRIKT